jgi:hypothetical protein
MLEAEKTRETQSDTRERVRPLTDSQADREVLKCVKPSLLRGPLTEQYRPKTWAGVLGQDMIAQHVQALAKRGLVGRGYWISGQSGTGKTIMARLISAEVQHEFLIQEVDAAGLTVAQLRELEREMQGTCRKQNGRRRSSRPPPRCSPWSDCARHDSTPAPSVSVRFQTGKLDLSPFLLHRPLATLPFELFHRLRVERRGQLGQPPAAEMLVKGRFVRPRGLDQPYQVGALVRVDHPLG